ncbi:MAG: transketolase C-terminal domain-containing protein, partial [Negativicutes bacterium]|nr:transketolase C-terminal domain-containing protein [Negativicutes bacterium]
ALNTVTSPEFYMDYKYRQNEALEQAGGLINDVAGEFGRAFGRNWSGVVEGYKMEDAEHALVAMGSAVSDARIVIDALRAEGKKVGLVKVRSFRPFPAEALRALLKNAALVTVLDKNIVFGSGGALGNEIKSTLYGYRSVPVKNYIIGLGGRDVGPAEIRQVLGLAEERAKQEPSYEWFGL